MLVPGPLGRGSRVGQGQPLLGTSPELPGRSYKAIQGWSLPELGLEVCVRGHTAIRGRLPPVLGLGQPAKVPGHPSPEAASWLLCKAQQLNEPWGYQGWMRWSFRESPGCGVFQVREQVQICCQCRACGPSQKSQLTRRPAAARLRLQTSEICSGSPAVRARAGCPPLSVSRGLQAKAC